MVSEHAPAPAGGRRFVRFAGVGHRVTQFELFFDLVFVFAFTQVTALMAHEHELPGLFRGLTVLGILWWSWAPYTWLANQVRMDRGIMRIGLAVATVAVFVLATTISSAFAHEPGPNPSAFAMIGCYLVVRLVHVGLFLIASSGDPALRHQVVRTYAISLAPVFALLFVGAWLGGPIQTWLWIAAWFLDLALVLATSWGGRGWRLHSAEHWAERYALIVILAIGESVVSIGVGLAEVPLGTAAVAGTVLAVIGAVLLWWLYFDRIAPGLERALAARSGSARVVAANRGYTDFHYPIVAGVILTALGVEHVMAHIDDAEPLGWLSATALAGGIALYLSATIAAWRALTGGWLIPRAVVAVLLIVAVPVVSLLTGMLALALAIILGVVLIVIERTTLPDPDRHDGGRVPSSSSTPDSPQTDERKLQ